MASTGRTPSRSAIAATVASAAATRTADRRFIRNATDPIGTSWASQARMT